MWFHTNQELLSRANERFIRGFLFYSKDHMTIRRACRTRKKSRAGNNTDDKPYHYVVDAKPKYSGSKTPFEMECRCHFSTSTSYRELVRYFRAMMTGYYPHFLATCRTCRINASARLARTVCPKYKPVTRCTRPVAMANLHLDSSTSKKLFLVRYLGEGLSCILFFGLPRRYFHSNGGWAD